MRLSRVLYPGHGRNAGMRRVGCDFSRNAVLEKVGIITEGACSLAMGAGVGPCA